MRGILLIPALLGLFVIATFGTYRAHASCLNGNGGMWISDEELGRVPH